MRRSDDGPSGDHMTLSTAIVSSNIVNDNDMNNMQEPAENTAQLSYIRFEDATFPVGVETVQYYYYLRD